MKKGLSVFLLLYVVVFVCFCYLIYKTWDIFGFWTLMWTGLVTSFSGAVLGNLIGARSESNGKITFNPKEWPKFLSILVSALIGYYLYTIISVPTISNYNYYFGLSYLILLTGLPIIWSLYKLFRDRNDYVEIEGDSISYKDNKKTGKFSISQIESVLPGKSITLNFKDGTSHTIALSEMNFNGSDQAALLKDLNSRLVKDVVSEE